MTIAVTGTSGFIGGAIARSLASDGRQVLSLGRTQPAHAQPAPAELARAGKRIQPGLWHVDWDIREPAPAEVAARAQTVDTVIHAAGLKDDWVTEAEAYDANVTGTRNVLDAFPSARVITISCAFVYDPQQHHEEAFEESGPVDPDRYTSDFEKSLAAAEAVVARVAPDALVLRPAPVYAAGTTQWLDWFNARAVKGTIRLPNGGKHLMSLCSIDNVIAAVGAGIRDRSVSGAVNVADPEPYVLREALTTALARADCELVTIEDVASDLSRARAWWDERRAELRGGPKLRRNGRRHSAPPMTRFAARVLSHDRMLSLSRLRSLLGVDPVQGLAPHTA